MSIVSPSPGRLSPGRKTPPRVSAPSPGLRLLIVSRFKWGRGPYRGHSVIPCAGNTIWLQYSFIKELLEDSTSACRERIAAATGPSPFKVGDNQRPERTMSGVENLRLSLPFPAKTCPGEVGGINCGGDMGVRRCLARSLTSLAFRCALQRVQTVPAAIHSGRIPPPRPTSHGDGRLSQPPHHAGHGPFRTRPPNLS